jgi:predicted AlkP superfamily phosphohydrolase/phosphomutase
MKWVNSSIRWQDSKVFCIPNSNEGYFRVNLQGREPQGVVRAGAEYDDVLGTIEEELQALRNPRNGVRAADRVVLTDHVFTGAQRQQLPDAVISWNREARVIDQLEAPRAGLISKPPGYLVSPFYTGNHRATAFMLARGPNVPGASTRSGGNILDLAPTILAILGVDQPSHHEGQLWAGFA